jgi:hypothetical protein
MTMQVSSAAEVNDAMSVPFVVCPHCGNGAGYGLELIDEFLMGKSLQCQTCRSTTDAWAAYLKTISHAVPFIRDKASLFIGYQTRLFSVAVAPGGTIEIDFCKHGVPPESRVVRLNYTSTDARVHPIELHSNDVPLRRGRGNVVLYGKPFHTPVGEAQPAANVSVYVVSAKHAADEYAQGALATAFAALAVNEFVEMVIPAIMAVEFACKRLISDLVTPLSLNSSGIKDKELLRDIVVRQIAVATGVSPLACDILQKVARLWGQRDSVAHRGHLHTPYDQTNAAPQLAAAVFAFRYCQLLRRKAEAKGLLPPP